MAKKVPKRLLEKAERIADQMNKTGDPEKLEKLFDRFYKVNEELQEWKKKNIG